MREYYEIAELLTASWRLAKDQERIPISHGLLDHALKKIVDDGQFPEKYREHLTFSDTRIGMRCLELPTILNCAQASHLTSVPNPAYETVSVNIGKAQAMGFLDELGIRLDEGKRLGECIADAIRQTRERFARDYGAEFE